MKIELVEGASTFEAAKNTIGQIDTSNMDYQNIIVVPDAFSMQAEKLVFDCLNINSTFNIKVVGISKLASLILRENNIPFKRISAIEEVFNIYYAVKKCEENFLYFKKCDVDFCMKILLVIKQFKACGISAEKIGEVGDFLLDKKMHDIKDVYIEYEKLLGEKLDLSKLLEKSVLTAKNSNNIKNTNLYFANFDSFTLEIGQFICKLAGCVNKICVGMTKPISEKNKFIFEDDIFKKITQISKDYNQAVEVTSFPTKYEKQQLAMLKNLFAFDVEKGNSDFFLQVCAKNSDLEVEFVAKYIKNQVYKGRKFNNFAVAIPDAKYYDKIKSVFQKYQITCYSDDAENLANTILGRFVLKCLEISKLGFDMTKFEYIVSNPLFECEEQFGILRDIFYFQIDDKKEFLTRFPQYKNVIETIENLKNLHTIADFVKSLKTLIEIVKQKYEKIVDNLDKNNLYKKSSENAQAKDLILSVFDRLVELGQNNQLSINDFESILVLAFKSVKVETVPSYIDAVYVGDATESYFEDVDVLFVLGANAGSLPKVKNDTGIIDDFDIKKLRLNYAIEPEIKVLNRRNRLKIFECLLHAQKKLIVCNPVFEGGKQVQEASFVTDLSTMFGRNVINYSALENFDSVLLDKNDKFENMLFYLGNKNNFSPAYRHLKLSAKLPAEYAGLLEQIDDETRVDEKFENLDNDLVKKFAKKTISASELERYFHCPFSRFLTYKLCLKEKESVLPDKRVFGSFMHELLEVFVNQNKGDIANADIEKFLNENFDVLLKNNYKEKIYSKKSFVKYLRNESKIILKNVVYEQKHSNFRPIETEKEIFDKFGDEKYLKGFVDRIDVWDDYFRIIDYKTGQQDNIKNSLYYGTKLQLFLYANSVQKSLGLKCGGVYYFDCQTKYKNKDESKAKLFGFTKKSEDVLYNSDRRFDAGYKSDILGITAKENPKNGDFPFKFGNMVDGFERYFNYASSVSKQDIKEMEEGYIKPSPITKACEYCKFNSICKHRKENGERILQPVDDSIF